MGNLRETWRGVGLMVLVIGLAAAGVQAAVAGPTIVYRDSVADAEGDRAAERCSTAAAPHHDAHLGKWWLHERPERTFGGHYRGPRADVRMYFGGAAADLSRDHGAHYRGPRGPLDAHYHQTAARPEVTVVRNPRRVMVIVAVPRQLEAAPAEQAADELIVHGRDGGWARIRPSRPGQATEAGGDTDRADAEPRDGDRPEAGQAAADGGEGVAEESEATSATDNAAGSDAS